MNAMAVAGFASVALCSSKVRAVVDTWTGAVAAAVAADTTVDAAVAVAVAAGVAVKIPSVVSHKTASVAVAIAFAEIAAGMSCLQSAVAALAKSIQLKKKNTDTADDAVEESTKTGRLLERREIGVPKACSVEEAKGSSVHSHDSIQEETWRLILSGQMCCGRSRTSSTHLVLRLRCHWTSMG